MGCSSLGPCFLDSEDRYLFFIKLSLFTGNALVSQNSSAKCFNTASHGESELQELPAIIWVMRLNLEAASGDVHSAFAAMPGSWSTWKISVTELAYLVKFWNPLTVQLIQSLQQHFNPEAKWNCSAASYSRSPFLPNITRAQLSFSL